MDNTNIWKLWNYINDRLLAITPVGYESEEELRIKEARANELRGILWIIERMENKQ